MRNFFRIRLGASAKRLKKTRQCNSRLTNVRLGQKADTRWAMVFARFVPEADLFIGDAKTSSSALA